MALLGVSNLTKAFGTDLLFEGVSFEVQANDKIGVVGVNGSGKTTLFKMITGEMRPDDGELYQSKQAVVAIWSSMCVKIWRKPLWMRC